MAERITSGQVDQSGVRPLNVFVSTQGQGWCLTEAPNAAAVVAAHAAVGVPLDGHEVHEVQSLV